MRAQRSRARRLSLVVVATCGCAAGSALAQPGALDTIPTGHGYGAADAGRTGKLPPGPAPGQLAPKQHGTPGQGKVAGSGGAATGATAGGAFGNVGSGGTEGAGSR
jgi:hypothetical protein